MGSLRKLFRSGRIYLQLFIEKRRCYVIDINGWRTHSIYHCVKTEKRQEANLEKMTESKLHKQFFAWMSSLVEKLFLWLFRLWINNDKKRIVYCFWICVVMKVNIVWRGFIYWKNNQKNSMIMFCSTYQQSLQFWIIWYKVDGTVWYDTHCLENNTPFLLGNTSHSLLSILIAQ